MSTPTTDMHARTMPGYADRWVPRYVSEALERQRNELLFALEQLVAKDDQQEPFNGLDMSEARKAIHSVRTVPI